VYITNEETRPEQVWRAYRPRSDDENRMKEAKYDMGLDGFTLEGFWATESVMVLLMLVFYNILNSLRRHLFCRQAKKERICPCG
jgi:hypothetical protein